MAERIIDCCSLLNLYAGWAGLEQLRQLPHSWFVCEAVFGESEITREYDENQQPQDHELVLAPLVDSGLIQKVAPESDAELADYLNFAQLIDDGEAQAIALAKHRGFVLLTDDRKALKLARREDVGVRTISTVDVLREWIEHEAVDTDNVRAVLKRIRELARYMPPKNSPELVWWLAEQQD
jgi:predicted nucleic acid-binding protein